MTAICTRSMFLAYVRGVLRECPTEGERNAAIVTAHGAMAIIGGMKWDEAEAAVERECCEQSVTPRGGPCCEHTPPASREVPGLVGQTADKVSKCRVGRVGGNVAAAIGSSGEFEDGRDSRMQAALRCLTKLDGAARKPKGE